MSSDVKIKDNKILPYVIALFISIIVSLMLIILFALCIKLFNLSDSVIAPVNLVIKGVSVLFGLLLLLKNKNGGLVKGFLFGAIYSLVAYLIFSMLSSSFSFSISMLLDMAYCGAIGGLIGMIIVNARK